MRAFRLIQTMHKTHDALNFLAFLFNLGEPPYHVCINVNAIMNEV